MRAGLNRLQGYAGLPQETFTGDPEKTRAARYDLIVLVEAAAAICNHLCARLGRLPESYPGCFETLGDLGIIEADLARRLSAMARLRNLLVHGYARVNDGRIHRILREDLLDAEAFLERIGEYLQKEGRTD